MIYLKSASQIAIMRKAGALLYEVLGEVRQAVKPGMSTKELDGLAEKLIRDRSAKPSFLGYRGFPATLCTSVNEQVVHGIPSETVILRDGDILSVDCGLILDGWQSDSAFTVGIGEISPDKRKLIEVTEQCFFLGARQAVNGGRLQDISHAIQTLAESHGYGVIRELVGHGIGRDMHEEPSVPNFGKAGQGPRLRDGMTLAVEPMISLHDPDVMELSDGWTIITTDQSPCAHYEHTLAINERGLPELLSYPGYTFTEVDRK
ncbi:MAG TPA: type I methionyl aminopeptidase [Candidatus Limiplasma sp.]|nr:type I methionyl aminopeptidase [Candidatus Limiplasma sp.]HRX09293.1 type I methionyl aminopeptidase [Candidatus Limiplasma sp.]